MKKSLREKVDNIIDWSFEKKAENVVQFDVKDKSNFTDAIVICQGSVELHNKAIAEFIIEKSNEYDYQILSKEGLENGKWILLDLIDVVVHIFTHEKRDYYKIEDLYKKAPKRNKEQKK